MSCTAQTVAEVNDVTPSMVERGSVNAIPITSGSKKYNRPVRGLKNNQKQMPVSGRSVQQENNDVTPSMVERGSVNAIPITSGSKKYSRPGSKKYSRPVRGLKNNQKQMPVSGRSMQQENKEIMSEVAEHPVGWKLKKSSHSILQQEEARPKEMLKAARRLRNLSENLQSKEQNEQISVKKGGSSMKKARRKIIFDRHASPLIGKSKAKTYILSPESLSLKRSRSGRLLLPTLDFWRNQIPVYDADRNITGIQEELKLYGVNLSLRKSKRENISSEPVTAMSSLGMTSTDA